MPSSACDWSSDVCSSDRSEEHTSELQSRSDLVCRLLLEKKKKNTKLPLPSGFHSQYGTARSRCPPPGPTSPTTKSSPHTEKNRCLQRITSRMLYALTTPC